jgi:hypothetical protein
MLTNGADVGLMAKNEHQLGGTRGEATYVVFARAGKRTATEDDIVTNVNRCKPVFHFAKGSLTKGGLAI